MSKKINLLILSLIITIGVFVYLSIHHYTLKVGGSGSSLCAISSNFNCDAAAYSSYSELFRIPMAVFGGIFHVILLGFVLCLKVGLIQSNPALKTIVRSQLLVAAAVSILMALISLLIVKVGCPFCIASYILSFISLFLGWNVVEGSFAKNPQIYFAEYKAYTIALLCVPFFSWVANGMIIKELGLDEIQKYIPEKIAIWKAGTEFSFDSNIGLAKNVQSPKFTLVEFADFKCPHCKHAVKTIDAFLSTRNDVNFIFKPFPLDGSCNPSIPQKGDNSRCLFAAYTLCAEKLGQKGWQVQHWLFENQEKFFTVTNGKDLLPEIQNQFGLDAKAVEQCSESNEIYDQIVKSTEEGVKANIEGTPTIYLNGKKLPWGQVLEVLKAATSAD